MLLNKVVVQYGFHVKISFCCDDIFCDVLCLNGTPKISNYFYGIKNLSDEKSVLSDNLRVNIIGWFNS